MDVELTYRAPLDAEGLIGFLGQRAVRGELVLDPAADLDATRERLLAVPGIGPWTAAYIEMRALGNRDAFLASDLGVRRRSYRAYALQHLWSTLN